MIIEVEHGDHGIEDQATLKELASFLNELLEAHPEYSDRTVMVAAECGYSGACIATPLTAATIPNQDYSHLCLITDDDGQYSDSYKFYRRAAQNENN